MEIEGRVTRGEQGETVTLPEEIAFGREIEVTFRRQGDSIVITPKRDWKRLRDEFVAFARANGPLPPLAREPFEPPGL